MPTPYTDVTKIKSTVSHLTATPDAQLNMIIADAALEVDSLLLLEAYQGETYKEKLVRYLTIHLATLKPQEVLKQKVDILELTYKSSASEGLAGTVYGQEYERMVEKYTGSVSSGVKFY